MQDKTRNRQRRLSDSFMQAIDSGVLSPLLRLVRKDGTLHLAVRDGYVNTYYRGGNIMRIEESNGDLFTIKFDKGYANNYPLANKTLNGLPRTISSPEHLVSWLEALPYLKQAMDVSARLKPEREIEQLIAYVNNRSNKVAGSTDYFICDMEYTNTSSRYARFDLVGVHWPSSGVARKRGCGWRLALMELKCGTGAVKSSGEKGAGLRKHLQDLRKFLEEPGSLTRLKEEMICVFNQQREMGLITCQNDLVGFAEETPEYIILLAEHDPESRRLLDELHDMAEVANGLRGLANIRVATANFLGYGLFEDGVYELNEFLRNFSRRIHTRCAP